MTTFNLLLKVLADGSDALSASFALEDGAYLETIHTTQEAAEGAWSALSRFADHGNDDHKNRWDIQLELAFIEFMLNSSEPDIESTTVQISVSFDEENKIKFQLGQTGDDKFLDYAVMDLNEIDASHIHAMRETFKELA